MSPHATEYMRLLRDLRALNEAGQEDSPEADALGDQLDVHWFAMTEAERVEMRAELRRQREEVER